jgi:endonuclease I
MKNFLSLIAILLVVTLNAQIPAYYNGVNLNLTGMSLKSELTSKISATHTNQLSYTPGVWNVLKDSDLDPTNSANVILVYGWDDTDADETNDRTRDKDFSGGSNSNEWNREHVFPKSKGTPDLGTSGPGSDAHNLRPADVDFNGARSNREFATGSGTAGTIGSYWYPGDEWKGDVARIYMYMYVRYTTRCKPGNACIGNPVSIDLNMVELLLQWNIDDPVSDFERTRNDEIYDAQGNRNPFIDNAYLATLIWGGSDAENVWLELGIDDVEHEDIKFSIYPNPSINGVVNVSFNTTQSISKIEVFDISGKITNTYNGTNLSSNTLTIDNLNTGIYFLKVTTLTAVLTKKIVIK